MTDSEVLELIQNDEELAVLAQRGDDSTLARRLAAKLPAVRSGAVLRSADLLRLFGWTRGVEILSQLPASFAAVLSDGVSVDLSDPSAPPFWEVQEKAGVLTADEKAQLLALGKTSPVLNAEDIARITRPWRPEGKIDPAVVREVQGARDA